MVKKLGLERIKTSEENAWIAAQEYWKQHGVDLKSVNSKDWFIIGWHFGAMQNNARFIDSLLADFSVEYETKPKSNKLAKRKKR